MTKYVRIALLTSLLSTLIACGSGGASSGSSPSPTPTPTSPSLASLQLNPGACTLVPGGIQQFSVQGKFSDGSSKDMTATVQWSSSDPSVATITGAGKVTAVAAGAASVTATSGSMHATATVTVTGAAANLVSITLAPASFSLPVNTSQQFSATGTYSDGSSSDLTDLVNWSSSASAVATVNLTGAVTGVKAGSATISASLGAVSGSTTVTVTAPTISSIVVTPDGLTLGIGISQQYTATAIYSDGSTQDLVSGVTWSSSATSVATITGSGLLTTVGAGSTTITATVGTFTDTAALTVVAAHLVSISVAPSPASMALGTTLPFTATGSFDDGSTQLLTSVIWSSSSTNVATVDPTGLVTGVGTGTTNITATSGTVSGSSALTVTAATVVSIAVTPSNASMAVGTTKQFTATATFTDGSTENVTSSVVWGSSNPAAATVNNQGLVTSVATGSTTISAGFESVTGTTNLTVSTVTLVGITIVPANPKIAVRTFVKFSAVGTFSDGSTGGNLAGVSWKSSSPKVASMRSSGLAFGKKAGTVTITASASGLKGTTSLTVSSGKLLSIAITPASPVVSVGSQQQFTATGTFSDGTIQDVTIVAHWSSSSSSVATIANAPSTAGLATTTNVGTTTIGANSGGITSSTTLSAQ